MFFLVSKVEFQDAMELDRVTIQKIVQKLSEDINLLRNKKYPGNLVTKLGL